MKDLGTFIQFVSFVMIVAAMRDYRIRRREFMNIWCQWGYYEEKWPKNVAIRQQYDKDQRFCLMVIAVWFCAMIAGSLLFDYGN